MGHAEHTLRSSLASAQAHSLIAPHPPTPPHRSQELAGGGERRGRAHLTRTVSVALPAFTYSVVKQPRALRRVNELHSGKRKSAPVCGFGPGDRPRSVFSLPPKRGGRRADKAHCPDYSGRVSGLLRTMRCIANAPPRLAARQRGILAFKPLTVVGPGRLLVAGEAARVRPGDGGCVSHPLAGAAPAPRRQDAS
jgi:hypothetical protein